MAITEESRHRLYQRLEEVLGVDQAAVLMEHLPPVGWADVATKRDLDAATALTSKDLQTYAVATRHDVEMAVAGLRLEIGALAESTRSEFVAVRSEIGALAESTRSEFVSVRSEIAASGDRLRAEWRRDLLTQTFAILAANAAAAGVVLGVLRLG